MTENYNIAECVFFLFLSRCTYFYFLNAKSVNKVKIYLLFTSLFKKQETNKVAV